jgi:hypothetical protein
MRLIWETKQVYTDKIKQDVYSTQDAFQNPHRVSAQGEEVILTDSVKL